MRLRGRRSSELLDRAPAGPGETAARRSFFLLDEDQEMTFGGRPILLALRLLRHDLQINEISVATEFQGNLPDVQLDGMEIQQVLLNLVRNAIDK